MLKSNLIQILSKLSSEEIKKFEKFLLSPYFNNNEKVVDLFHHLKKYYPKFDSLQISKENIYRKLYKDDKVVLGTMYYLTSELESLLEKFISIEKINPIVLDISFLNEMNVLRLHGVFANKYKQTKKNLKKITDAGHFLNYMLTDLNSQNVARKRITLTKKDFFKTEWFNPMDELVILYLKNALLNIRFLWNMKRTANEKINIPLLKELTQFIEANERFKKDPEIKMLYTQIKMLSELNDKYFYELKSFITGNSNKLTKNQLREVITDLQVCCTEKILQGNRNFIMEEFEIVNLNIKFKLFDSSTKIPIDMFFQSFMLAISLEKYDWAKMFVKKYIKFLEEKFQSNAYNYCYARLYYQDGQYDKALRELAKMKNYSFIHYKAAVKILLLMIYYELNFFTEAEDVLKSFSQFLRNDRLINSEVKKSYDIFIKIFSRLIIARNSIDRKKLIEMQHYMEKVKSFVVGRKWFNSKIEEMNFKYKKINRAL